jgi:translation initiation factor IF-2
MSKVRINDLARELEVKSKQVLDLLPELGITEKKTHSSSLEDDEADKVRRALGKAPSGDGARKNSTAPSREEPKPKIDLSKISKPGDVLKAIKKLSEPEPKKAEPALPAKPAIGGPLKASVVIPKSAVTPKPQVEKPAEAPAAAETPAPPAASTPPPAEAPRAPRTILPQTTRPAPSIISRPAPPAAPQAPAAAPPTTPAAPATPAQPEASAPAAPEAVKPSAPAPAPPPRRVVVPQTGPRPVYSAPKQQPSGMPIGQRPGGMPVRGQPIFQRPRAGAPGGGPGRTFTPGGGPRPAGGGFGGGGYSPGQRRPMHPTRQTPGGRPPLGAPGLPPPGAGRPAGRPGAPPRRPGQRYVPKQQEGPMKGYVPPSRAQQYNEPLPITREITIPEGVSVKDLAEKLDVRAKDLIARLLARGVMATVNQTLDSNLATELANHFGAAAKTISFEEQVQQETEAALGPQVEEDTGDGAKRPPVVTIMGHVDHGKTSLLDAIRETDVAAGEAGGITQHIGAYKVKISKSDSPAFGREITFLDTPGHEAFTRMRARGAKVTDIVVLVVAADDGVMPQTLEAIDHAKAAGVPLIVAVNKIDKPGAMPERVKKQLADRGLMPEDWGGNTVFVDVSAKQKTNLDLLLEMICLTADIQGLKANADRPATGSVVEAKLDRGRGAVATVLVQNGTLKTGDTFVVGNTFGRVRAMFDDRGNAVTSAGPSTPVEVLGLEGLPTAGDQMIVVERDKAKGIAQYREMKAREATLAKQARVSLESLSQQIAQAGVKELPIILKGDVAGSVEVLADTLQKLSTEKVKIKVLHTGVGAITETDVLLASASNAIIIGFNVRPERKAQEIAEQEQVDIRLHSIIYELQDEIRKAMAGLLEPIIKETYQGRADVKNVFKIPKVGTIAGCQVSDGTIKRDASVRLIRGGASVFTGKIGSLKRFKDDAAEVRNGMECGIAIAGYGDIKVGDVIEAFTVEKIAAELTA